VGGSLGTGPEASGLICSGVGSFGSLTYTVQMKRTAHGLLCLLLLTLAGCAEPERRPSMDVCTEGAQCELGYCIDGHCLDPMGDEDLDELLNGTEVALGTDPFSPDTDQDGAPDGQEVVDFLDPADEDGDGRIDALESSLLDEDCDGWSDQSDADFSVPYAENLVESGGGETYSGWSIDEGSWGSTLGGDCSEAPEPTSGSKFLVVGSLCEGGGSGGFSQISQKLALDGVAVGEEEVYAELSAMLGAVYDDTAAVLLLEPLDATGASLGEPRRYEATDSPWVELKETVLFPPQTRTIRLSLRAEREESGPLAAVFDELEVRLLTCPEARGLATSEDPG